jgi:hypothetical protein
MGKRIFNIVSILLVIVSVFLFLELRSTQKALDHQTLRIEKFSKAFEQHKQRVAERNQLNAEDLKSDTLDFFARTISDLKVKLKSGERLFAEVNLKDSLLQQKDQEYDQLKTEFVKLKGELKDEQQKFQKLKAAVGKLEFNAAKDVKVYYAGDLENGKATGTGYGLYSSGSVYSGEWKDNKRHGKGKYTWKDGSIYEGEFVNDERQGLGTYYFASGEKYVGEWLHNKRSGKGTLFSKDGKELFKGNWENDEFVKKQ